MNQRYTIKDIKAKIVRMLEERTRGEGRNFDIASPSKYWSDYCSYFDYLLGLPDEAFSKLRVHTFHLTSDNINIYHQGGQERKIRYRRQYDRMAKDMPPEHVLDEPHGGIGFRYDDGRFISRDIIRFQRTVRTFYKEGIFDALSKKQDRGRVLEIGAGYGGLAHHLSRRFRNATYFILDLPETLLFSASYLSMQNSGKSMYLYSAEDFGQFMDANGPDAYDFVLLPNYVLPSLRHLNFDVVINVASMQEMRADQVQRYLDFIKDRCSGVFYSFNQDRQSSNTELENLSRMLDSRFELRLISPPPAGGNHNTNSKLKSIIKSFLLARRKKPSNVVNEANPAFNEYLAYPKASGKLA